MKPLLRSLFVIIGSAVLISSCVPYRIDRLYGSTVYNSAKKRKNREWHCKVDYWSYKRHVRSVEKNQKYQLGEERNKGGTLFIDLHSKTKEGRDPKYWEITAYDTNGRIILHKKGARSFPRITNYWIPCSGKASGCLIYYAASTVFGILNGIEGDYFDIKLTNSFNKTKAIIRVYPDQYKWLHQV